ncbi:MAG: hypothetical protein IKJ56_06230 [Bacteroidales bacterium]|nr:hypothetical protein [Bacteroidales bacterium]
MEYTYKLPKDRELFEGVKIMIKAMPSSEVNNELIKLLDIANWEIQETGLYCGWNRLGIVVYLNIPIQVYIGIESQKDTLESHLKEICNKVIPTVAGYSVVEVVISSILGATKNPIEEIMKIVPDDNYLSITNDLIEKGKRMANAYVFLYALENHIRKYIDTKLTEKIGADYIISIAIPKKLKQGIETRKSQEQSKKWLPLRGDNNLYYLDFIDLADVIANNWDYFKDDIPSQEWIKIKMQDVYDIRCLIAHNSYISDDNIQLLESTTKQIISQLY